MATMDKCRNRLCSSSLIPPSGSPRKMNDSGRMWAVGKRTWALSSLCWCPEGWRGFLVARWVPVLQFAGEKKGHVQTWRFCRLVDVRCQCAC